MIIGKRFIEKNISNLEQKIFAFCDFRNSNFSSIDLSKKMFVGCNFEKTSFSSVNLEDTIFDGCFSSVYAPTFAHGTNFELAVISNTHMVVDFGEEKSFITTWDDETEELLHNSLTPDGIDYHCSNQLDDLFQKGIDNSIVFGFHLGCAMFVKDGFQRGRMLDRLFKTDIFNSKDHARLVKLYLSSFLGDPYHGVRYAVTENLKRMSPSDADLTYGIKRIFSENNDTIAAGLQQIKELLTYDSNYIRLVSNSIKNRLIALEDTFEATPQNEIYLEAVFILDELHYIESKL